MDSVLGFEARSPTGGRQDTIAVCSCSWLTGAQHHFPKATEICVRGWFNMLHSLKPVLHSRSTHGNLSTKAASMEGKPQLRLPQKPGETLSHQLGLSLQSPSCRGCGVVTDQSSPVTTCALGLCMPQLCSAAIGAATALWWPGPACTLVPLPAAPLPTLQAAELAAGLQGSCCDPGKARRIRVSRLMSPVATLERRGLSGN